MNSLSGNLLAFSQQNRAKFIAPSLLSYGFFLSRIMLIVDRKSFLVNKKIWVRNVRIPQAISASWRVPLREELTRGLGKVQSAGFKLDSSNFETHLVRIDSSRGSSVWLRTFPSSVPPFERFFPLQEEEPCLTPH